MISEGNWQLLSQGNSPPNYFGWAAFFNLDFPCDYALIKIAIPSNPNWVRAGWIRQISIGTESYVLISRLLNQEGRLVKLEPIDNSILVFSALPYVANFGYKITVRYID